MGGRGGRLRLGRRRHSGGRGWGVARGRGPRWRRRRWWRRGLGGLWPGGDGAARPSPAAPPAWQASWPAPSRARAHRRSALWLWSAAAAGLRLSRATACRDGGRGGGARRAPRRPRPACAPPGPPALAPHPTNLQQPPTPAQLTRKPQQTAPSQLAPTRQPRSEAPRPRPGLRFNPVHSLGASGAAAGAWQPVVGPQVRDLGLHGAPRALIRCVWGAARGRGPGRAGARPAGAGGRRCRRAPARAVRRAAVTPTPPLLPRRSRADQAAPKPCRAGRTRGVRGSKQQQRAAQRGAGARARGGRNAAAGAR
jgi:hypothetical protein